ncbi:TonB-dependent receptor [Wenzhouxiangellaceae bacterium CH-27]|uniref:TonB-dependent receptor n=2 Tax=Elongatibacter sediminis TaxID=3119006 RepID=A0AAW9RC26_9GAMM
MCLTGLPAPVAAQDQAADPLLEEVIVTAQYREERLQDVPISISAFDGDSLRELRVSTPADLARITPGLFMNRSSVNQSDPEFTLRGIGTNDSSPNQNPAAPLYVDGVSVPFNAMVGHVLFDQERVEVLKGPQGTLYGRNSTAGAVNFISTRPGPEREGYFTASYGERDRIDLEGGITIPISDRFSMRFAGVVAQEDGWQTIDLTDYVLDTDPSFADPVRRNGDVDRKAIRISALFTPSDSVENLFILDAGRDDSQVYAFKHAGNLSRDNPAEFCSFVFTGIRNDNDCVSFAYDSRTAPRIPVNFAGRDLFIQDPGNRGDLVTVSDPNPDPRTTIKNFHMGSQVDSEALGLTNTLNWSPGRFHVTSVTGYRTFDRVSGFGQQGGPFITIGGEFDQEMDVFTQELRIASDSSWDDLYWVAGLFYSNEDIENYNIQNLAEHKFFSAIFNDGFTQKTDVIAAFGQVEWSLNDQVQLVGGLRFTSEDRSFHFTGQMVGAAPQIVPEYREKVSSDEATWRLGVNFRPNDNWLWYGNISTGFRGKGFPASIAFSVPQLQPFNEETLTAYEAGFKSVLLDGDLQFNTAVYYYDFEDFQAQTAVEREGLRLIVLANAGQARVIGTEVDVRWFATESLSFNAGVNWMDAEIRSGDYEGDNMIRSPDVMARGSVRFDAPQSIGGYEPFAQLDFSYNSKMDFILANQIGATEGSYWLLNARVGMRLPNPDWEVSLWIENLTDEVYKSEVFGPGSDFLPAGILYGPPRQFGATVTYTF